MTSNRPTPDGVVLGVIPGSSRTRRTRVAHSPLGFIGRANEVRHADALPINDTASTACHSQKSATSVAIGPTHHSVTANNRGIGPPRARLNRTTTAVVSLVAATVTSAGGLALVALAALVSAGTGPVATASLVAAALCGLVLIVAALIGGRP